MLFRETLMQADEVVRAWRRRRERIARKHGATRAQWVVLAGATGGRSVAGLARRLGLSRQSVQRVADLLVERGLATFEPNPEHRRSPLLERTPSGEALLRELARSESDWEAELSHRVEPEELEAARVVLEVLRDELGRDPG